MTIPKDDLERIIATALAEDIGAGDITSELTIPETAMAEMAFIAGQELVACGTFIPEMVLALIPSPGGGGLGWGRVELPSFNNAPLLTSPLRGEGLEGQFVKKGTILATASGNARALLAGERVALNLMQRLSGVATLTHRYVEAVKGTKAIILDTRKTMPGLRMLDKYAVRVGGGQNHRMRLDDMVLIKDNHIVVGSRVAGCGLRKVIEQVKVDLSSRYPNPATRPPIIVECDTLEQVKEALVAKPDRILLDNMSVAQLTEAALLVAGKIPLEASGGVTLSTVKAIAQTGIDYISVGALTHSAPAADIRADITIKTQS